ncbi:UNKNOWN [Stylonychia lemnae]|uniref:Uncharacterized protein n=1 Tax=Stylonychia lemnae TaxID=5949 RepID=A0A078AA76_STYLE|nr:UNKNOWN [Stylonychia lemnae]|eukprot:CDW79165.1 UNKNOWN [Stylonychia lemnae]
MLDIEIKLKPSKCKILLGMFNGSISQIPYQVVMPLLPWLTQYIFMIGQYGLVFQALCHIGILIARLFAGPLIKQIGSRLVIMIGGLLTLQYFIYIFYLISRIFTHYIFNPFELQYKLTGHFKVFIFLSFLFGIGIFLSYEGNHRYIKHCAVNIEKIEERQRRQDQYTKYYNQLVFFFKIIGIIIAAVLVFDLHSGSVTSFTLQFDNLMIFCSALSLGSFVIALMMPAPYTVRKQNSIDYIEEQSDHNRIQSNSQKNHISEFYDYESPYYFTLKTVIKDLFTEIFSTRMAKYTLHIICSASMSTMFESVAFVFMYTKIRDNVQENELRVAYLMFIPYVGIYLLLSFCTCRTCYDFNDQGRQRTSRKWGAIINLFTFLGMCIIAIIFRTKKWDFYKISAAQTIGIFVGGAAYCGLCDLLLQKQRKSLAFQGQRHKSFYQATQIVEEFVKAVIQIALFLHYYIWIDQWNFEELLGFQFFILIAISLALGMILQVLIWLFF